MAEGLGLAANLWSPLAGGMLTGKYRTSGEGRMTDPDRIIPTEPTDQKTAVIDAVHATGRGERSAPRCPSRD